MGDERRFSPEDLLTLPDGDRYELVNGLLQERHVGQESSWVAGEIYRRLANIIVEAQLGWTFPEGTSYQCFPWDRNRVRKPDASFVQKDKLPNGPIEPGHVRVAPDLVVEVISPNDVYYHVLNKVDDYLRAGVRLVWVVNPDQRSVTVFSPEHRNTPRILTEDEELTGESVVPGFRCPVAGLFPTKPSADAVSSAAPA